MSGAPFRYYLRVRYAECDPQQVVFNSRYAEYVDVASMEFLRAAGLGAELKSGEFDFQLVKQTLEWKQAARYDDILAISARALGLGNTSFTLSFEIRRAGLDELIAICETVYVRVDPRLRKLELGEAVRSALAAGARGRTTDHAAFLATIPD